MNIFEKIKAWFFREEKRVLEAFNEIVELEKAAEAKVEAVVDVVEDKVDAIVTETKRRVERVKEEVADIKEAVKEVVNQVEDDVVAATKGKSRSGRKPKAKK